MKLIVIGLGQTLRGDDAAGIEAVRRWERFYPATASRPDVTVHYSELPGLGLLELIEGFDAAVLVDAVSSASAAGQVYRLDPEQLESFGLGGKSAHGWGIAETLEMHRQLNPARPTRVRLVGIEASQMGLGQPISPEVEAAFPAACAAIDREVRDLLS